MRVCVPLEHRFHRLGDGSVWTQTQFKLSFWQRYLDVFDHVRCVARVLDVERLEGEWHQCDGEGVSFAAVPHYVGVGQFLMKSTQVRRVVRRVARRGDAFVLRVPGNLAGILWRKLQAVGYPYGVEVVGDPHLLFAPDAVQHPLRGVIRWRLRRQLRRQCLGAAAASYVTRHTLPERYPSLGPAIVASSVELLNEMIAPRPWSGPRAAGPLRLIFVGSLEQYYKGPDVLIRAVARCRALGSDLQLAIVGDGRHRGSLEALARELGCGERIRFVGQLALGRQVCEELDAADLFVLPSRAEGLPRAMLEAMARGLPCIGSTAGGIPELLPQDALVTPGDPEALAERIVEFVRDPARMQQMAARNLECVKGYRASVLQRRRIEFYRHVRDATEQWLASDRLERSMPESSPREGSIQLGKL
jgi:glycosyltransferase involved in cell wall biosynthesis